VYIRLLSTSDQGGKGPGTRSFSMGSHGSQEKRKEGGSLTRDDRLGGSSMLLKGGGKRKSYHQLQKKFGKKDM